MGQDFPATLAAPREPDGLDSPPAPGQIEDSSVRPVTMPFIDRLASAVVTGVPPLLVLIGMFFGWSSGLLVWQDLLVLAIFY
jgi:hypothetical protein